ncbi:ss-dsDNA regulator [Spinach severe curly top virus]|uniref:Ss-dsDNA regulator n=1 Tax=Spinach severe curly top virus TaxID=873160 RepID=E0YA55_9GEMI|nr:ss-dsDNA regulator [Spinach severe curly top virus]ADM64620.1 ss-dsDNA regulator [Spinach severe curly top virus]
MGPFKVDQFPGNYPAFLAVSTSCFLRYNKWCILGVIPEIGELTLEEGEVFLQFQKEVKKLLRLNCSFGRKCILYQDIYKKYVKDESEKKNAVAGCWEEEEEDSIWEEIPMEEVCSKEQKDQTQDV